MSAKAQDESQAAAARLSSTGAKAYVTRADLGARGIWYRVRVGEYETRAEAKAAGAKLASSGHISTFIIVPYEPGM
jgi:cell division protein FtsN